jgi:transposase-like protein
MAKFSLLESIKKIFGFQRERRLRFRASFSPYVFLTREMDDIDIADYTNDKTIDNNKKKIRCPYCDSNEEHIEDQSIGYDSGVVCLGSKCNKCNKEWIDKYSIIDFQVRNMGNIKISNIPKENLDQLSDNKIEINCPYCKSDEEHIEDKSIAFDSGFINLLMRCTKCNKEWKDQYKLIDYLVRKRGVIDLSKQSIKESTNKEPTNKESTNDIKNQETANDIKKESDVSSPNDKSLNCPFCKADEEFIEDKNISYKYGIVYLSMKCGKCKKEWNDRYKLID